MAVTVKPHVEVAVICDVCNTDDIAAGTDNKEVPALTDEILRRKRWMIVNKMHVCPKCAGVLRKVYPELKDGLG